MSHFIRARTYRKLSYHPLTVKQGPQENLRSYIQRSNLESLRVDILDKKFDITTFIAGLGIQSKDLMFSILKNPRASMAKVLTIAEKYINGKEALCLSGEALPRKRRKSRMRKNGTKAPKRQRDQGRSPRKNKKDRDRSPKRRGNVRDHLGPPQPKLQPRYPPQQFTPLTASVIQVLYEVQHEKFLRWPYHMRRDPVKRDITKYCEFHRDHGHRTDDCIQLKKEIEFLI